MKETMVILLFSVIFWIPVIDGELIPDKPRLLLESGRVNQKDVMTGVNKDEGTMFVGMDPTKVQNYSKYHDTN